MTVTNAAGFPILSLLTWAPLVGVIVLMTIRGEEAVVARNARWAALWTSLIVFAFSLKLWWDFDPAQPGFQFNESLEWLPQFKVGYKMGVDGISVLFVLLSTALTPICILASWEAVHNRVREYMIAFLVLETMMVGAFAATDFIVFYMFFEGLLIPMYVIIGVWGGPRRVYASFKFFLYTLAGSVLMLLALLAMWYQAGTTDIVTLMHTSFSPQMQTWLFVAFLASFAVKVPMWPVHTWLPDAHVEAPTAGSVILAGVLLKMGGYGFLRFSLPMLPLASQSFAPLMFTLGVVAVIYTSLVALAQTDMKKLIAYSSVAHMGLVVIGTFTFNMQGIEGAILQMLSHGIVSAALFLCVGVVYDRIHSREIARYGGLADRMPAYAFVFLFFTMASMGLPGTSGFVGEFMVLVGAFKVNFWVSLLGSTGMILGAAYALWLYRRIIFGKITRDDLRSILDLSPREIGIFAPLVLLTVWMGVYPSSFTQFFDASVGAMVDGHKVALGQQDTSRYAERTTGLQAGNQGRIFISLKPGDVPFGPGQILHTASDGTTTIVPQENETMNQNWVLALPEIVLSLCAMAILVFGVLWKKGNPSLACAMLSLGSLLLAAVLAVSAPMGSAYNGLFAVDHFAVYMKLLILVGAGLSLILSIDYNVKTGIDRFEFPVLILLCSVGMMVMASATNLMSLYVGLELQSLSIYVMAAFNRDDLRSSEAGLKYFVLGALASGLLLYGASLAYGFNGSMDFAQLRAGLSGDHPPAGLVIGVVFIVAGLAFKISAVPFHMWTPDVYEGAPTAVTAFMSTAPKVAAIALLLRALEVPFGHLGQSWTQLIVLISIASMLLGSLAAIGQTSIKRLMAYSSIGHMGYALIGLAANSPAGIQGVLVYMATYVFMSAGVFACVIAMRRQGHALEKISDLSGLARTDPMLALAFGIFMFSMAGIPPFSGFFGKLYVFYAAVQGGYWTLAVIGVLTSVIGAYYYLRVIKVMYFDDSQPAFDARSPSLSFVAAVGALVTTLFFLFPAPVLGAAQAAAAVLFG